MDKLISILIKGNSCSSAGFSPLLLVGVFPSREEDKMDTQPLVKEPVTYRIRHAVDYIGYSIVDTNVRSSDASRSGRLVVGVTIPREMQLKGGQSPYTLLKNIYTKYVNENMTISSDGVRTFKTEKPEKSSYDQLLQSFELEERRNHAYVEMSSSGGVGVVCAPTEEKLEELFRDSQYPEFQQFSQIEVGRSCEPSVNIDIPRKKEYHVYLNGRDVQKTLRSAYDRFDSKIYLHDTEFTTYVDNHVCFTLEDLTMSADGTLFNGRVRLQDNRIDCKVNAKEKMFPFYAVIASPLGGKLLEEEKSKVKKLLSSGKLKVLFGGEDYSGAFLTEEEFLVIGEKVKDPVTLTIQETEEFIFSLKKERGNGKLVLIAEQKKKRQSEVPPIRVDDNRRGFVDSYKKKEPVASNATSDVLTINFRSKSNGSYEVIVTKGNNGDKFYQLRQPVTLMRSPNTKNEYGAVMTIDRNWQSASGDIYIQLMRTLQDGSVESTQQDNLFFTNSREAIVIIDELDFDRHRSSSKWIKLGAIVMAATLIGGGVGFFIGKGLAGNGEAEAEIQSLKKSMESLEKDNLNLKRQIQLLNLDYKPSNVVEENNPPQPEVPDNQGTVIGQSRNEGQNNTNVLQKEEMKKEILTWLQNGKFENFTKEYFKNALKTEAITPDQKPWIENLWWKDGHSRNSNKIRDIKDNIKDMQTIEAIVEYSKTIDN